MTVKKVKNPQYKRDSIEQWLEDNEVIFTYDGAFPIDKIDFDESLKNQARMNNPLQKDVVELYAESMLNGDVFPATVGYIKNDQLVFIDGNHRGNAWMEVGERTVPVYILNARTRKDIITKLTYEANARHGMPNSVEERIEHALWLVRSGHTQKSAANIMNVKSSDVSREWRKSEVNRRAKAVGINNNVWNSFGPSGRIRLASIKNDNVFKMAANICYKHQLKYDALQDLAAEVNSIRSASGQIKFLNTFATGLIESSDAKSVVTRGARTPKQWVPTYAKSLIKIFKEDELEDLSRIESEEMVELLNELISSAAGVVHELKKKI